MACKAVLMFWHTAQIAPFLKCCGVSLTSDHISVSFEFHVAKAPSKFSTIQLSSKYITSEKDSRLLHWEQAAVVVHAVYFKIRSRISFANAMTKPPKKVRKPVLRCEGSWDCKLRPICTTPQPSRITPMALMAEKTKVDRLLMAVSGSSPAAKAGVQTAQASTQVSTTAK